MPIRRRTHGSRRLSRPLVTLSAWLGLLVLSLCLGTGEASAQICDPVGSPPRFGCQWSLDLCQWVCPICDPYGPPPRTSCTWDGNLCNWICTGYTGTEVTVKTQKAPDHEDTVYLRMSSLCTATGAGAFCSGSFPVDPTMTTSRKCQAIADAIANDCSAAGYVVTMNDCQLESTLVASNLGCPATPFALGLSNDPAIFDQTGQGTLPDGENEKITGTSSCSPMPGTVDNLQLVAAADGSEVLLTWSDTADATDYLVFSDTDPNGIFSTVVATATSGATGVTVGTLSGDEYFLVAGRNSSCGVGPKR
jgi:hypothetical protein